MLYDRAVALKRYPAVLLVDNNLIRSDLLQIVEPGVARCLDRDDAPVFVDDRGHQLRGLALDVSGKNVIDGLLERIVAGHRRDGPRRCRRQNRYFKPRILPREIGEMWTPNRGLAGEGSVRQHAACRVPLPSDRHEQLVDRNGRLDQRLLCHVAHQRLQRGPVGLDPIRPGVTAEGGVDLVELGGQARQHVAQRAEVAHLGEREVLGRGHRLVETRGDERMLLVDVAADGDEMHDREDARAPIVVELARMKIREQPLHVGIGAQRQRQAAADDGLNLAGLQQLAE